MIKSKYEDFTAMPLFIEDGIPVFSQNDKYIDNYKKIAADHIKLITSESDNPFIGNELWVELDESTRELVEKYTAINAKVLDVGVGLGRVIGPLDNYNRYGIDISFDYLKVARDKGIEVSFSKIEDMPYQDAIFDSVVSCDVLEHVFNLDTCVKEILRVLKPGGHLFIRVPYKEDLKVYLRDDLPYEFIHLRNFDENSIKLYFEKIHSCKVLEVSTVAPYWQGETRLRYRMPKETDAIHEFIKNNNLKELGLDKEGELILDVLASITEEKIVAWINRIIQEKPKLFDAIKPYLTLGIEMNVVIQKQ